MEKYTEEHVRRVAYLISRFITKKLSTKEYDELDEWMVASEEIRGYLNI